MRQRRRQRARGAQGREPPTPRAWLHESESASSSSVRLCRLMSTRAPLLVSRQRDRARSPLGALTGRVEILPPRPGAKKNFQIGMNMNIFEAFYYTSKRKAMVSRRRIRRAHDNHPPPGHARPPSSGPHTRLACKRAVCVWRSKVQSCSAAASSLNVLTLTHMENRHLESRSRPLRCKK